jgi:hypothetical protein
MERVNSLSMMEKMASTSPLGKRSGAFSRFQRMIRAKPCCGPKLHCPNWAVTYRHLKLQHVTTLRLNVWICSFSAVKLDILTENKGDATAYCLLSIKYCLFAVTGNKDITSISSALSWQRDTQKHLNPIQKLRENLWYLCWI